MSLGSGSLAIRRLKLLVPPKKTPLEWIASKLKEKLISPLDFEDTKEESTGWCHPFSGEPSFKDLHDLIYDGAFAFGFRTDKKRIPATLMKLQMKAALDAVARTLPESKNGKKKISKKVKDGVKDRLKEEMLRRTLPNIRLIEVVWHLDSNEIWLSSVSDSVFTAFEKLFVETFELALIQLNPGTTAIEFDRIYAGETYSLRKIMEVLPVNIVGAEGEKKLGRRSEDQVNA